MPAALAACLWALLLGACGGGGGIGGSTGTASDAGPGKTYLSVAATDPDGNPLQYQWRVNGGSIQNVNASQTVWTMPDGPGVHFAYVLISNGKGGYVQQQYAVSTDSLGTNAPARAPVSYVAPAIADFDGSTYRLRFRSPDSNLFTPPGGGTAAQRFVYLPDLSVQVLAGSTVVYSGFTDLAGEINLPKLQNGQSYTVNCAAAQGGPPVNCGSLVAGTAANVIAFAPSTAQTAALNLHLFGHIALADGTPCGTENAFFAVQSAATVQLQAADGTALGASVRVNRYGDYGLFAAVPVNASLKLAVQCEAYSTTLAVPSASAGGYTSASPVELSWQIPGRRPVIGNMIANGADGNVRGSPVVEPAGVAGNLPGAQQFLAYKGKDSAVSACLYYQSIGAVKGCDAQGNLISPISFNDWLIQQKFAPYNGSNPQVSADYINRMDLNLVRHMVATQSASNDIAFYVCNHPGPVGNTQAEIDQVIATGESNQKLVACVAMEWSTSPGVNGGKPFTKFLTFAPDGSLLPSVNLDGRGEKYLPGTCVACHGGTQYNGSFPSRGNPSPLLGSLFLPFYTGNYLFGSAPNLTEAAQSAAFKALNTLVSATAINPALAATDPAQPEVVPLIAGWYADGGTTLNKAYVPPSWSGSPGAASFYTQVIAQSCRTCHSAMPSFNWDVAGPGASVTTLTPGSLGPGLSRSYVCGGTPDVAINASMPNALISRNNVGQAVQADPALQALMNTFLGCSSFTPVSDPVYPKQ